jgi:hypothetical protein
VTDCEVADRHSDTADPVVQNVLTQCRLHGDLQLRIAYLERPFNEAGDGCELQLRNSAYLFQNANPQIH